MWDSAANSHAKGFLALSSLDKGQPQNKALKLDDLGWESDKKSISKRFGRGWPQLLLQVRRPTWSYRDIAKRSEGWQRLLSGPEMLMPGLSQRSNGSSAFMLLVSRWRRSLLATCLITQHSIRGR